MPVEYARDALLRRSNKRPRATAEGYPHSNNGRPSRGRCRVAFEDFMRPNNKFRGNVFVANLPLGYSDEELAQAFDAYGLVLGAHLARDPITGSTKGYGLVNIAPDKAAAAAATALNGTE